MTPILFDENEINFNTLGIGALTDATMCKVSRVLNGVDELSLQYPVGGSRFSDIKLSRIIYAQPEFNKDPQPYRIYHISTPLMGVITVLARHVSEQRNYIPVKPFSATSVTDAFAKLPLNTLEDNPFEFWTDKTTSANFNLTVPTSLGQVLGGMEGSILDTFHGEYEFDKWLVRLWNHRGEDRGVTIRYGKNMTNLVKNDSIDNTITGIVPYWVDADGNVVTLPEYAVQSEYADSYPFKRTVVVDFSADFAEAPTEAQLRSRAQAYITNNNIGLPTLSLRVFFEQLSQYPEYADYKLLDTMNLGDTIQVIYDDYDISVSARIVETEYDCLLEKYQSVTIGSVRASLESSIKQANDATISKVNTALTESKSFVRSKVDEMTAKITGINGGHVVMHLDANDEPYEILVMDTDDINTAVHVLRINMNGIGFSDSGYAGPYDTAWTLDGNFVADFITAGTMLANRIKGGTLTLGGLNDSSGLLLLYDGNNNQIVKLSHLGIDLNWLLTCRYYPPGTSQAFPQSVDIDVDTGISFINTEMVFYIEGKQKVVISHFPFIFDDDHQIDFNTYKPHLGWTTADAIKQSPLCINLGEAVNGLQIVCGYIDGNTESSIVPFEVFNDSAYHTPFGSTFTRGVNIGRCLYFSKLFKLVNSSETLDGSGTSSTQAIKITRTDGNDALLRINGIEANTITATNFGGNAYTANERYAYGTWYFTGGSSFNVGLSTWFRSKNSSGAYTWSQVRCGFLEANENISCRGNFSCTGTKSRVVKTKEYSDRLLYAYETPSPLFGDVGEGQIGEDGICYVWLDPILAETITTNQYQVFLQRYGSGECYVLERKAGCFVVTGTPLLSFGWELKAKQADFDQKRLEILNDWNIPDTNDYGEDAMNYIKELNEGRLTV